VDNRIRQRIRADYFKSKAKFSPFDGWQLTATVAETYVGGECVYSNGEILGKPQGSVLSGFADGIEISPRRHVR
jgi:dihydroorotase-like cyclic amidohydrolase